MPLILDVDETLTILIFPPMELHKLLGIVTYIIKALSGRWPDAEKCLAALHISMKGYQVGQFIGNDCKKND